MDDVIRDRLLAQMLRRIRQGTPVVKNASCLGLLWWRSNHFKVLGTRGLTRRLYLCFKKFGDPKITYQWNYGKVAVGLEGRGFPTLV